jgi:hypothetical protein
MKLLENKEKKILNNSFDKEIEYFKRIEFINK